MRLVPPTREQAWLPYLWLCYLGFFVADPIGRGAFAAEAWSVALGVAIFLPLYFWAHWLEGRRVLLPIVGLLALGAVLLPFNAGASVFIIFAASFAARVGGRAPAAAVIGAVTAVAALEGLALGLPTQAWATAAVFSVVIGATNIHLRKYALTRAALEIARQEIEYLARVAERERIGRDLHDLLGHTLSVIAIKSDLAARLAGVAPDDSASEIRDVGRISREALAEVRAAVQGYRQRSLPHELERARIALDAAGVGFEYEAAQLTLLATHETVLALALREAVTNVLHHAGARRCTVRLEQRANQCALVVADDGRGGDAPEGAGLSGMRHRIEALGGHLHREGTAGTRLEVTLPLRALVT